MRLIIILLTLLCASTAHGFIISGGTGGGSGDVTAAGNETITGDWTFSGDITIPRLSVEEYAEATTDTITAAQCTGGVIYVTGAATLTLPATADGQSCSFITIGAVAVSVKANASDLIYLDGTALDDGDKITNTSTAGDTAVCTYYDATGWSCITNSWTDGGP